MHVSLKNHCVQATHPPGDPAKSMAGSMQEPYVASMRCMCLWWWWLRQEGCCRCSERLLGSSS